MFQFTLKRHGLKLFISFLLLIKVIEDLFPVFSATMNTINR